MINISSDLISALNGSQKPRCEQTLLIGGISYTDKILSYKESVVGSMLNTFSEELTIKILGTGYNFEKGTSIMVGFSFPTFSQVVNKPQFFITKITETKDEDINADNTTSGYTVLKCGSVMTTILEKPYSTSSFDFTGGKTVAQFFEEIMLLNDLSYIPITDLPNADLIINVDPYGTQKGITYRTILNEICALTCSIIGLNSSGVIEAIPLMPQSAVYSFTNRGLDECKLQGYMKPVNSLIFSLQPQNDDAYIQDVDDISENGLHELRLDNITIATPNIPNDQRQLALANIFPTLKGLSAYALQLKNRGNFFTEVGDFVTIDLDNLDQVFGYITEKITTIDTGAISTTFKTTIPTATTTNYSNAVTLGEQISNTTLVVDKQEQTITGLAQHQEVIDGQIVDLGQQILATQELTSFTFTNRGSYNLIRNSVGIKTETVGENEVLAFWTPDTTNPTQIWKSISPSSKLSGAVSGYEITARQVGQTPVLMKQLISNLVIGQTYSLRAFIWQLETTISRMKIGLSTDGSNNTIFTLYDTTQLEDILSVQWDKFDTEFVATQSEYYIIIEMSSGQEGITTNELGVADLYLVAGDKAGDWTPHLDEYYTDQVVIDSKGIQVKSDNSDNPDAVTSITEDGISAVYLDEQVFSVSGQQTIVKNLTVNGNLDMSPLKIIPITNSQSDNFGWNWVRKEN
jgi:hypothetical protein